MDTARACWTRVCRCGRCHSPSHSELILHVCITLCRMPVAVCASAVGQPKLQTPAPPPPQDCMDDARGQMEMVGLSTACSTHTHCKGGSPARPKASMGAQCYEGSLDAYMGWGLQSVCVVCPQGSLASQPASSSQGFQWRLAQI